jgi:cytidine deaminase
MVDPADPADDTPSEVGDERLLELAREAHDRAHVPYSEYPVGAALLTADGSVYTGCNVENANYSNSLHAEEVALGAAVADGHREFRAVAVSSGVRDGVTPCGMCRQSLSEFCPPAFRVVCEGEDGPVEYRLGDLLPAAISGEDLAAASDDPE